VLVSVRGAALHQKVVVTGVGDIRRARGARAYNGGLGQTIATYVYRIHGRQQYSCWYKY